MIRICFLYGVCDLVLFRVGGFGWVEYEYCLVSVSVFVEEGGCLFVVVAYLYSEFCVVQYVVGYLVVRGFVLEVV